MSIKHYDGQAWQDAYPRPPLRRPVGGDPAQNISVFAGKTALFFGDSLTEQNYHYTKGYHAWVKEILGLASYKNYGVSGYKVSDVYNKVKTVTDSADIVFVMCGVNDQNFSVPLGAMGDNTTGTTYGALDLLCAELKSKYPTSIITFITPAYQNKYPHSSGVTSYEVSKAIREVCEKYAIPVYDNFTLSGIYNTNLSVFTTDKCHWNDTAHEMVGKNIARFVSDSFCYVYGATSGGDVTVQPEYQAKNMEITGVWKDGEWHVSLYAAADALPSVGGDVEFGVTLDRQTDFTLSSANPTGGFYMVDAINDLAAGFTPPTGTPSRSPTLVENGDGTYTITQNYSLEVTRAERNYWCFPLNLPLEVGDKFTVSNAYIKVGGAYYPVCAIGGAFAEESCVVTDAG